MNRIIFLYQELKYSCDVSSGVSLSQLYNLASKYSSLSPNIISLFFKGTNTK